jgi:hypothetical protein
LLLLLRDIICDVARDVSDAFARALEAGFEEIALQHHALQDGGLRLLLLTQHLRLEGQGLDLLTQFARLLLDLGPMSAFSKYFAEKLAKLLTLLTQT